MADNSKNNQDFHQSKDRKTSKKNKTLQDLLQSQNKLRQAIQELKNSFFQNLKEKSQKSGSSSKHNTNGYNDQDDQSSKKGNKQRGLFDDFFKTHEINLNDYQYGSSLRGARAFVDSTLNPRGMRNLLFQGLDAILVNSFFGENGLFGKNKKKSEQGTPKDSNNPVQKVKKTFGVPDDQYQQTTTGGVVQVQRLVVNAAQVIINNNGGGLNNGNIPNDGTYTEYPQSDLEDIVYGGQGEKYEGSSNGGIRGLLKKGVRKVLEKVKNNFLKENQTPNQLPQGSSAQVSQGTKALVQSGGKEVAQAGSNGQMALVQNTTQVAPTVPPQPGTPIPPNTGTNALTTGGGGAGAEAGAGAAGSAAFAGLMVILVIIGKCLQGIWQQVKNIYNQQLQNTKQLISTFEKYQTTFNVGLLGTGKSLQSTLKDLVEKTEKSATVKATQILKNMQELIKKGVVFNVEERAYLQQISQSIVNSFDAANDNLLRLIRLQQKDSTQNRLSMQFLVNNILASNYQDTSYMNESFKTVSRNLLQAQSQMNAQQAETFQFAVQKWLGALTSLGLSSQASSKLSQGLGYLGSGDISSLSGNSTLMTLLATGAAQSNLDISTLFLAGLTDQSVNQILAGITNYIKRIAQSSNQVVRSQFGRVYGFTQSDFRAFQNLQDSDIITLFSSGVTSSKLQDIFEKAAETIPRRLGRGTAMQNLIQNEFFKTSAGIYSDDQLLNRWLVLNNWEKTGLGYKILQKFGLGQPIVALNRFDIMSSANNPKGFLSGIGNWLNTIGNYLAFDTTIASRYKDYYANSLTNMQYEDYLSDYRKKLRRYNNGFIDSGIDRGISASTVDYAQSGKIQVSDFSQYSKQSNQILTDITTGQSSVSVSAGKIQKAMNASGDKVNVSLQGLDDSVMDKLTEKFSQVVADKLEEVLGTKTEDGQQQQGYSISDLINKIMNDRVNVYVTNDNTDVVLSKLSLANLG